MPTPRKSPSVPHGNQTHGHAQRGKKTAAYLAWESMRRRCTNPSQESYPLYGGRGITVCARWSAFENFLADMGECLPGMSLDRIDPNGHYEPSNCRWIAASAQAMNKRNNHLLTHDGKTQPLTAWARELGIKPKTLRARVVDHGMSVSAALSAPVLTAAEAAALGRASRYGTNPVQVPAPDEAGEAVSLGWLMGLEPTTTRITTGSRSKRPSNIKHLPSAGRRKAA